MMHIDYISLLIMMKFMERINYRKTWKQFKTFAALTVTLEGMPLIYNGQEANLSKRLKFFEKDSIDWKNYELSEFYKNLFTMKKNNQALWNGKYGGNIELISNENDSINLCFIRQKEKNKVFHFIFIMIQLFVMLNQKILMEFITIMKLKKK